MFSLVLDGSSGLCTVSAASHKNILAPSTHFKPSTQASTLHLGAQQSMALGLRSALYVFK